MPFDSSDTRTTTMLFGRRLFVFNGERATTRHITGPGPNYETFIKAGEQFSVHKEVQGQSALTHMINTIDNPQPVTYKVRKKSGGCFDLRPTESKQDKIIYNNMVKFSKPVHRKTPVEKRMENFANHLQETFKP